MHFERFEKQIYEQQRLRSKENDNKRGYGREKSSIEDISPSKGYSFTDAQLLKASQLLGHSRPMKESDSLIKLSQIERTLAPNNQSTVLTQRNHTIGVKPVPSSMAVKHREVKHPEIKHTNFLQLQKTLNNYNRSLSPLETKQYLQELPKKYPELKLQYEANQEAKDTSHTSIYQEVIKQRSNVNQKLLTEVNYIPYAQKTNQKNSNVEFINPYKETVYKNLQENPVSLKEETQKLMQDSLSFYNYYDNQSQLTSLLDIDQKYIQDIHSRETVTRKSMIKYDQSPMNTREFGRARLSTPNISQHKGNYDYQLEKKSSIPEYQQDSNPIFYYKNYETNKNEQRFQITYAKTLRTETESEFEHL